MRVTLRGHFALCLLATIPAVGALADELPFSEAAALPANVLETVRGGFEIPENLHASLTLDRTVQLNGETIAHLSVAIPDIGNMTAEQASALATAASPLVIQNGPDNTFNLANASLASTVIQNTLSDQHLTTLTTIGVGVNTLGTMRETNFSDGLARSLSGIAGVR